MRFTTAEIEFLVKMFKLEGKLLPNLKNITHKERVLIYSNTVNDLHEKLMNHKNIECSALYLESICRLNERGILPISIVIILESLDNGKYKNTLNVYNVYKK